MKHTNTCPLCGCTKIFKDDATKYFNHTPDHIWSHDVDRYICLNCGHIEEWAHMSPPEITCILGLIIRFFDYE